MDEDETERYFNSLCTQVHHSNYNVYDRDTVPSPDDDSCTESEQYVRVTVVHNCKLFVIMFSYDLQIFIICSFYKTVTHHSKTKSKHS